MKVMLTVLTMSEYFGTAITTLEQGRALSEQGWDVSIFTLEVLPPLDGLIPAGFHVYTLDNIDQSPKSYDLIIARQRPLLDYLLFSARIQAPKVYYECVGYKVPVDFPPTYYESLSLMGTVSTYAKTQLVSRGYKEGTIAVIPNSAPKGYFELNPNISPRAIPRNIAVISNHMPAEIEELPAIAESHDVNVSLIGLGHEYQLVTPELLVGFDLIVTIGKTAYYAIAAGIPVYCYDENVSSGYVNLDTFGDSLAANFAIKEPYSELNSAALFASITTGYEKCLNDAPALRELAGEMFSQEAILTSLLSQIEHGPEVDYEKLYSNNPAAAEISRTYCEDLAFWRSEARRWYEKSLELGSLYQTASEEFKAASEELSAVYASRGWKAISRARTLADQMRGKPRS